MYKFYFTSTSYVVLDILQAKYLSKGNKYKLTFYESTIPRAIIILNNDDEIIRVMCKLKYFLDGYSPDLYDANYIYISNYNEYGDETSLICNYKQVLPIPTEEDDIIQLYISKYNAMSRQISVIYNIDINMTILDNFIQFLINTLEILSVPIIERAEVIFCDLMYGDFIR